MPDIRLPKADFRPDITTETVRPDWFERHGAWMVMFAVVILSQSIESFTARQIGPSIMGKMTLMFTALSVMLIILPGLILKTRQVVFTLWVNLPFQLYSLIAILSFFWSVNPAESLKAGIVLMCFHGTGVVLAALFSWRNIWRGIAWGILFLAFLSVLIIPHDGLMTEVHPGALRGLWIEKNASAESFAIGAIACSIIAIADRNPWYYLGTILLLGLIVMAQAAGALAACMIGLAYLYFTESIRRGPIRFFLGGWVSVMIVASIAIVIAGLGLEAAGLLGRETTLTGRTVIWPTVIDHIQQRPLLGYGFQAFWVDGAETKKVVMLRANFEAHNAHNSYFEMMLGIGALGSFFVAFGVLRCMYQSSTALFGGRDARRFVLAFLVFGLLLSLSESMLGDSAGMAAFVLGILVPKVALGYATAKGRFRA